jgi:hypothetical protein
MGEPMDGRCEDYANDPAVVYHAHDLPRCKNVCTVQIESRWLCNVHARLVAVEAENERLRRQLTRGAGELEAELILADMDGDDG